MSDNEILIEVAKLDGKEISHWENNVPMEHVFGDIFEPLPDYLNSRDEIIPVVKQQGLVGGIIFIDKFFLILREDTNAREKAVTGIGMPSFYASMFYFCLSADARQLSTALLKATGKWRVKGSASC